MPVKGTSTKRNSTGIQILRLKLQFHFQMFDYLEVCQLVIIFLSVFSIFFLSLYPFYLLSYFYYFFSDFFFSLLIFFSFFFLYSYDDVEEAGLGDNDFRRSLFLCCSTSFKCFCT